MLHKTLLVFLVIWALSLCEPIFIFNLGRWDVNATYEVAVNHLEAEHPLKLEKVKAKGPYEELDRYSHYSLTLLVMDGHTWERCTVEVNWPQDGDIHVEKTECESIEGPNHSHESD